MCWFGYISFRAYTIILSLDLIEGVQYSRRTSWPVCARYIVG